MWQAKETPLKLELEKVRAEAAKEKETLLHQIAALERKESNVQSPSTVETRHRIELEQLRGQAAMEQRQALMKIDSLER